MKKLKYLMAALVVSLTFGMASTSRAAGIPLALWIEDQGLIVLVSVNPSTTFTTEEVEMAAEQINLYETGVFAFSPRTLAAMNFPEATGARNFLRTVGFPHVFVDMNERPAPIPPRKPNISMDFFIFLPGLDMYAMTMEINRELLAMAEGYF